MDGCCRPAFCFNGKAMTLWKQVDRWQYHYFELDVEPSTLPRFTSLIDIWNSKREGRNVPAWRDFDFYDFVGWHGSVSIYEIFHDPFNFRIRLSGTKVDDIYKRMMKGATKQEIQELAIHREEVDEFYEMACTEMYFTHTVGPLNVKNRDFLNIEFFELPLSNDDGLATHTIEAALQVPTSK